MRQIMFDLTEKVAIVTGATKGLGQAMAVTLAKAGANIVVVSRHQEECDLAAEEIKALGVDALGCACDVSKHDMIEALVSKAIDTFGRIDILVNNAGTAVTIPSKDVTENDWDKVLNVNLKGVFFLTQAVGKEMIKQKYGRIVNIASMFGLVGDKNVLPYLVSKGGVIQMTRGLALEWAKYNIMVNAVAPGYVITSINEKELNDDKVRRYIHNKTPLRRYGLPEEIAGAVLYLASDEASFVAGSVYSVDGGWVAQ
jgi:NAD(P)-dependent dehydrogenase (short-subunit alcohol dehydrogenase family)